MVLPSLLQSSKGTIAHSHHPLLANCTEKGATVNVSCFYIITLPSIVFSPQTFFKANANFPQHCCPSTSIAPLRVLPKYENHMIMYIMHPIKTNNLSDQEPQELRSDDEKPIDEIMKMKTVLMAYLPTSKLSRIQAS